MYSDTDNRTVYSILLRRHKRTLIRSNYISVSLLDHQVRRHSCTSSIIIKILFSQLIFLDIFLLMLWYSFIHEISIAYVEISETIILYSGYTWWVNRCEWKINKKGEFLIYFFILFFYHVKLYNRNFDFSPIHNVCTNSILHLSILTPIARHIRNSYCVIVNLHNTRDTRDTFHSHKIIRFDCITWIRKLCSRHSVMCHEAARLGLDWMRDTYVQVHITNIDLCSLWEICIHGKIEEYCHLKCELKEVLDWFAKSTTENLPKRGRNFPFLICNFISQGSHSSVLSRNIPSAIISWNSRLTWTLE